MKSRRFLPLLTLYLSLVSSVIAVLLLCGMQVKVAGAASPSFVRIIHASPAIGAADVFVDGQKVLSNFQFGTVTPYVSIPAGPHRVQVALIGRGAGAASIDQDLAVQPGVAYTVAALGTPSGGFKLIAFIDNNLVSSGQAKLRVYNLSPDTDVSGVSTAGSQLVGSLTYQQSSNYQPMEAGSYTFSVATTQSSAPLSVTASLATNTVTSLFAIGLFSGTPKLQFITASVSGLPGLPGTGSDPYAVAPALAVPQSGLLSWLLPVLVIVVIVMSVVVVRRIRRFA